MPYDLQYTAGGDSARKGYLTFSGCKSKSKYFLSAPSRYKSVGISLVEECYEG